MWRPAVLGGVLLLISVGTAEAQFSRKAVFIDQLYQQYFDRPPFRHEMRYWKNRMRRGDPPIVVEAAIIGSPAYFQQNRYNVRRWIRDVHRRALGREPNGRELAWWTQRLNQHRGNRERWAKEFLTRSGQRQFWR